jgi:hypothetical protein
MIYFLEETLLLHQSLQQTDVSQLFLHRINLYFFSEYLVVLCVKPAAGLRAHLTEEEGVRSEACRDT